MSNQSEIERLKQAKEDIKTSITNKGVSVPSETKLDGMSPLIDAISQSEDLSAELTEYARLNAELEATIDSLPEAGSGGGGGVETCTIKIIDNTGYAGFFTIDFTVLQNDGSIGRLVFDSTGSGTTSIDNVVCGSMFCPNMANFGYAGIPFTSNNLPNFADRFGQAPDSSSVIGEIICG